MIIRKAERTTALGPVKQEGIPPYEKCLMVEPELLCGAGKLLATITVPPMAAIPDHEHHGEYEVYCILSGSGIYHENTAELSVSAGDVTYCPDGEGHGLVNTGDTDLVFAAFIGYPAAK